jgi:hypothetical protein
MDAPMIRSHRRNGFAALLLAAAPATPVAAERLTPPLALDGEVGDGVWLYGQINKGALVYDDGDRTEIYPLVDNDNSSTRAGFWLRTMPAEDFTFSFNAEGEWEPYSTGAVNRLNDDVVLEEASLRKLEAIAEVDGYGTLWIGQGSMASDGSSEQDLSGTSVAAYSSVSSSAGAQRFVDDAGTITGVSVGRAFSNYDGLGRLMRVRYDTPRWEGFDLGASFGVDSINGDDRAQWDVAARYRRDGDDVAIRAAAGFARRANDVNRVSGSASMLHKGSGLNLTLAAGGQERDGGDDPYFGYAKLGWRGETLFADPTALSIDLYGGDSVATSGSDSVSAGVAIVQPVARWQTDFYATARWYDYDDSEASYESGFAFLTGARFRF